MSTIEYKIQNDFNQKPVVWEIKIQPTFALVSVVRGD